MDSRKSICFWVVVLMIILTLPLAAAVQAPAGQAPGQRGGGGGGGGGARGPQPPPTNLTVMPKDSTRQQVIAVMQQFTMGLGVMCDHCHIPQAGAQPGPNGQIPMNFAADDKQTKKTARLMMQMMADVNSRLGSSLGKPAAEVVQVQCMTCHRGSAIPKTQ